MNTIPVKPHAEKGLTLIEMLIALMLGAFLLGSVIQTFLAARQSYRTQEGLSRLIENGRYALEFISRDVRMAGFRGCNSGLNIVNHLPAATNYLTNFDAALTGIEAGTAIDPNAGINDPKDGSDIITIRRADESGHTVTAHDRAANTVTLNDSNGLEADQNVLIADCSQAGAFPISNLNGNVVNYGNNAPAVTQDFNTTNAELFRIDTISYFVRTPDNALFQKINDDNARELVEGIEEMQLYYGEDTDLNPATGESPDFTANYYVQADQVVDIRRVVSIRIRLLAATPNDNVTAEKAGWTFDGEPTTANESPDHRIRREFTATIALRNRIN